MPTCTRWRKRVHGRVLPERRRGNSGARRRSGSVPHTELHLRPRSREALARAARGLFLLRLLPKRSGRRSEGSSRVVLLRFDELESVSSPPVVRSDVEVLGEGGEERGARVPGRRLRGRLRVVLALCLELESDSQLPAAESDVGVLGEFGDEAGCSWWAEGGLVATGGGGRVLRGERRVVAPRLGRRGGLVGDGGGEPLIVIVTTGMSVAGESTESSSSLKWLLAVPYSDDEELFADKNSPPSSLFASSWKRLVFARRAMTSGGYSGSSSPMMRCRFLVCGWTASLSFTLGTVTSRSSTPVNCPRCGGGAGMDGGISSSQSIHGMGRGWPFPKRRPSLGGEPSWGDVGCGAVVCVGRRAPTPLETWTGGIVAFASSASSSISVTTFLTGLRDILRRYSETNAEKQTNTECSSADRKAEIRKSLERRQKDVNGVVDRAYILAICTGRLTIFVRRGLFLSVKPCNWLERAARICLGVRCGTYWTPMLSRYWLLCALHDASRDTVGVEVAQMRPGMRPDTSRLGCVPGCGRTRPGLDASRCEDRSSGRTPVRVASHGRSFAAIITLNNGEYKQWFSL